MSEDQEQQDLRAIRREAELIIREAPDLSPPPFAHVDEEPRYCEGVGCGKRLRSHNQSTICTKCRKAGNGRATAAVPSVFVGGGELERFRVVATALGFDPDEVLARLATGWLNQLREKAGAP